MYNVLSKFFVKRVGSDRLFTKAKIAIIQVDVQCRPMDRARLIREATVKKIREEFENHIPMPAGWLDRVDSGELEIVVEILNVE